MDKKVTTQPNATVVVKTHLPVDLHRELKVMARDRGLLFSSFIVQLIKEGAWKLKETA